MRHTDELYVITGLVWLAATVFYGMIVSASGHGDFTPQHAHMGLLGPVISILFAVVYRIWPLMKRSWLAKAQFWVYQTGVAIVVFGDTWMEVVGIEPAVSPGSVLILISGALMIYMFLATRRQVEPASRRKTSAWL